MTRTVWFTTNIQPSELIRLCGKCVRDYEVDPAVYTGSTLTCEGCNGESGFLTLATKWMPIGVWE